MIQRLKSGSKRRPLFSFSQLHKAILENNREMRCYLTACHSHASGNPWSVSWMPDGVRHDMSGALT